ncbi:hypothetical protein [Salinimonas sediminis]|nr:hypothetical protein [Salinimonas sediminis]
MVNPLSAMASGLDKNQTNFFVERHKLDTAPPQFAEICTALYERELLALATAPDDIARLRQKLKGLSHHVKRAAHFMSGPYTPLAIDSHNASWTASQPIQNPARKITAVDNQQWFSRYATHGLVVCVVVTELESSHIELDSVDRVVDTTATLHTNKHGWFGFDGQPETALQSQYASRRVCKPTKALVTAACCGHQWNHKGRVPPRPLSLREILLASNLDWRQFRYPHKTDLSS